PLLLPSGRDAETLPQASCSSCLSFFTPCNVLGYIMHQVPHLEISSDILLHIESIFFVPLLIWLNTMARVDHMACCLLDIRVYSCAHRCQYRRTQYLCIRYCGEGNRKATHIRMNLRP